MFSGKYSSISSLPCVKINEKPPGITQLRRRQGYRSVNKCLSEPTSLPKRSFMDSPTCYQTSALEATEF